MKCPYCNNEVDIVKEEDNDGKCHFDVVKVKCNVCGLCSKRYTTYNCISKTPEEDVLNDWNNRICKLNHRE